MVAKQFAIIFGCIGGVLLLIALGFAIKNGLSLGGTATLCGFLGIIFAGLSGFCFLVVLQDRNRQKWLLEHGQRVTARITSIEKNQWQRRLGRVPYYLLAQWTDPLRRVTQTFRSGSIYNLPPYFTLGAEVSVLIDPNNTQRYMVELPPDATSH